MKYLVSSTNNIVGTLLVLLCAGLGPGATTSLSQTADDGDSSLVPRNHANNSESSTAKCKRLFEYHQKSKLARTPRWKTTHSHLPPAFKEIAFRAAKAAKALKIEVSKVAGLTRSHGGLPFPERGLSKRPHMITVCLTLKLGYVHIYQAGGASVIDVLRHVCPDSCLIQYQNWKGCGQKYHLFGCYQQALRTPNGESALDGLTLFTIVQDPAERFRSGLGEMILRYEDPDAPNLPPLSRDWLSEMFTLAAKHGTRVDVEAIQNIHTQAMKSAAKLKPTKVRLDPHIQLQSWFLTDFTEGSAQLLPQLKYVFPASDFNRSLIAMSLMFSHHNASIHHDRDSTSEVYAHGVAKDLTQYDELRADPLPDKEVMLLKEVYHLDYSIFNNAF